MFLQAKKHYVTEWFWSRILRGHCFCQSSAHPTINTPGRALVAVQCFLAFHREVGLRGSDLSTKGLWQIPLTLTIRSWHRNFTAVSMKLSADLLVLTLQSWRIGVALTVPSTVCRQEFWCVRMRRTGHLVIIVLTLPTTRFKYFPSRFPHHQTTWAAC
jgi:hypothetical protein